jgi:Ran GTPase-activating protein (RanGAP) involved in mRNA processing and transport
VPVSQLTNLFNAKCKDLELYPKDGQLRRFYDFCNNAIIGRKLIFREIGLGFNSAKILGQILRLNNFSYLDLKKNVLGNKGLKELAKSISTNASLIHVDIGSNDITYEGANSFFVGLRKHKTLSSISVANSDGLHRNRIGAKGWIGLNELLTKNKLITMINISDNSIGVEGIKTMLNGLTPNTFNLIYLNLTNNDLGPECIPDLKVMLESPHLQELRLSANTLNDTSAEALSLFFYKQVWQIRKIDLSNNKITSRGCRLLMQAIKQNNFLTHLNFENNPLIGNGELKELKHFLNNNEWLQNLNLSGCGIEAWHIEEAIEGLYVKHSITSRCGNNTLHTLNLSDNKLMGEGAMHFVEILENNTNTGLRYLDLSKNTISDEAGVAIAKALETNTAISKISLK